MWVIPSSFPVLKEKEVHLWLVDLLAYTQDLSHYEGIISEQEMNRARRFVTKELYRKFIITRGLLRETLSRYLGMNGSQVIFQYTENEKPFVQDDLHFNISHSKDLAIFAIMKHNPLGIDIEYKKETSDLLEICERFFSTKEYQQIQAQPQEKQMAIFYEIWVKKEAYIKAIGGRLFEILHEFKVKNIAIEELRDFTIQSIDVNFEYAAALATKCEPNIIRYFKWR